MMVSMGAVDESTVVVTVVHDCQVSLFHLNNFVAYHSRNYSNKMICNLIYLIT